MDETTVLRQFFRGDILLFSQTVQKLAGIQIFPKVVELRALRLLYRSGYL